MSLRPLPKELQEKAIRELNEVPNRLEDDVNHILEWAHQQSYLNIKTEKQWIVNFLRACKFSLQRTKEKLDFYYTFRTIAPEYCINRDPYLPEIQECLKIGAFILLPQDESDLLAPIRIFLTTVNSDPEIIKLETGMKAVIMLADILFYENDACVINGLELIFDMGGLRYDYISQATPHFLKSLAYFIQRAYPSRIKGIYFINVPTFFSPMVKLFTSFLSKKINNRVHFYTQNDINSLYEKVPRVVLPEENGGSAGSVQDLAKKLTSKMESYREWFQEDSKYCSDETKRPGKPRTADDFFNMEGSFRKLEVD